MRAKAHDARDLVPRDRRFFIHQTRLTPLAGGRAPVAHRPPRNRTRRLEAAAVARRHAVSVETRFARPPRPRPTCERAHACASCASIIDCCRFLQPLRCTQLGRAARTSRDARRARLQPAGLDEQRTTPRRAFRTSEASAEIAKREVQKMNAGAPSTPRRRLRAGPAPLAAGAREAQRYGEAPGAPGEAEEPWDQPAAAATRSSPARECPRPR